MAKEVLLRAEGICKSFGPTKAVTDFSVEINRGEIRGLIGENGSGKSTFSSVLVGLYQPDAGRVVLNGEEYHPQNMQDAASKGVALVIQEIGTIPKISVAANIFLNKERQFARKGYINHAKMYEEAAKILEQIGGRHIDPAMEIGQLNLEDRKLVEIARAMYIKPALLIIDETSNALSTNGRRVLYKNIQAVKESGCSVLFITHDINELIEICDSVTIMRDGHYITTLYGDEMKPKYLKELMVGREIAENFYRPDTTADYNAGKVLLRATGLNSIDVTDISLELHEGEILGIGGLAESGMHELGRILFGLDKPESGNVVLTEGDTTITNSQVAIRNSIGYLSKNRDTEALIMTFSIQDNICLPALDKLKRKLGPLSFILKKQESAHAKIWSEVLSIKCRSTEQTCTELSGGNKQKVVLSKWMGNESRIMIMDCPTRGIDIGVKEHIYKLMQQLKKEGRAIIMISEELPELIGMSDRILIIKNGRISHEELRNPEITEQRLINYMI